MGEGGDDGTEHDAEGELTQDGDRGMAIVTAESRPRRKRMVRHAVAAATMPPRTISGGTAAP